jgi:protein O-GlcNAc transferase
MSADPNDPAASLLAARAPLQAGRHAEALVILRTHLQRFPADARGWALAGRCARELGQLAEAEAAQRRALQLAPGFAAAWLELGLLRRTAGDLAGAGAALRQAVEHEPDNRAAAFELVQTLATGGAHQEALQRLAPLRAADPEALPLALLAAQLQLQLGDAAAAREGFDALLAREPSLLPALDGAYWARVRLGQDDPARLALATRIAEGEDSAPRWLNVAQEAQLAGDFSAARAAIARALQADPDSLAARWAAFQLPDSVAPHDDAAVLAFRQRWEAGLGEFEHVNFHRPEHAQQVAGCVGYCTAFYRHYLGDELADPGRYGRLVQRMMATLDTGISPRPLRAGRRRVGVVSPHLREHTVARLFVPLLEALDSTRFELVVFSLDDRDDAWSQRLRTIARMQTGPAALPEWRRRIVAAELDVVIYPEVGMDATTHALAALRLAPVQFALWGHPVSTGLPSIDLFLSADALEPADAQARYTETLVRLPGLGHGLREDDLPTPRAPDLWQPDPQRIDLLCAQTVFKLLPRQDRLFARILAALPEARLHLLADHRPAVCDWLRARMAPTLAAAGADPDTQLHIHGFVDHARYLGLAGACRLNLDTVGWSGGMSALDLLAQGLPTLCLPGESMRSRQTAALLQRLELPELIARDDDDYVAKAVTLARDPARCAALAAALRERRGRLFAEPATAAAFNALLAGVQRLPDGSLRLP